MDFGNYMLRCLNSVNHNNPKNLRAPAASAAATSVYDKPYQLPIISSAQTYRVVR